MHIKEHSYLQERARLDLAICMIRYEARTEKIRICTGFSDDCIRRLYTNHFKMDPRNRVRRRRGRSPTHPAYYVSTVYHQAETTTLAALLSLCGLIRILPGSRVERIRGPSMLWFGESLCRVFVIYTAIHGAGRISFDRAWHLVGVLDRGEDLTMARCTTCRNHYIRDPLALDGRLCPCCRLKRLPPPAGRSRTIARHGDPAERSNTHPPP